MDRRLGRRRGQEYAEALRRRCPAVEIMVAGDEHDVYRRIPDADVLFTWHFPLAALQQAKRLRWIQLTGTGAEQLLDATRELHGIVVTNAGGIHAELVVDFALGAMLMLQWDAKRLVRQQHAGTWCSRATEPLKERRRWAPRW